MDPDLTGEQVVGTQESSRATPVLLYQGKGVLGLFPFGVHEMALNAHHFGFSDPPKGQSGGTAMQVPRMLRTVGTLPNHAFWAWGHGSCIEGHRGDRRAPPPILRENTEAQSRSRSHMTPR